MEVEANASWDSDSSSSSEAENHSPSRPVAKDDQKWLVQFCKDMCCHTENISDLAASLYQNLDYAEMLTRESTIPRTKSFTMSGPAQVYVLNLLDKFPHADPKLLRRLGQKNWETHIRIRAENKEGESVIHKEADTSQFKPFSQFHDSGLGLSTATIEAYAASAISHSSFASNGERKSWTVPPLPLAARAGKPFTCDYCGQVLNNIKNRIDWKIHVFSDLQPYICTLSSCSSELVTFSKRALWAEHEFNRHRMRKTWICSDCLLEYGSIGEWTEHLHSEHGTEYSGLLAKVALDAAEKRTECPIEDQRCPFCLKNPATTRRDFITHLGRHLEEVALAVLPIEDVSDIPDISDSDRFEVNGSECSHLSLKHDYPEPILPNDVLSLEKYREHSNGKEGAVLSTQSHDCDSEKFKCSKCKSKIFSTISAKQRHDREIHLGYSLICQYCDFTANRRYKMVAHVHESHPKRVS